SQRSRRRHESRPHHPGGGSRLWLLVAGAFGFLVRRLDHRRGRSARATPPPPPPLKRGTRRSVDPVSSSSSQVRARGRGTFMSHRIRRLSLVLVSMLVWAGAGAALLGGGCSTSDGSFELVGFNSLG